MKLWNNQTYLSNEVWLVVDSIHLQCHCSLLWPLDQSEINIKLDKWEQKQHYRNYKGVIILICIYRHTDLFLIHSVANDDDAIADPHPKVLNFASIIFPLSSTSICNFITSPHAGAPTRPVPTFFFLASNFPTFRGFS